MLVLDFALEFKCGCKAGYGYNTKQSMIGAYPGPGVNRHTPVNDQHKQLKLDQYKVLGYLYLWYPYCSIFFPMFNLKTVLVVYADHSQVYVY